MIVSLGQVTRIPPQDPTELVGREPAAELALRALLGPSTKARRSFRFSSARRDAFSIGWRGPSSIDPLSRSGRLVADRSSIEELPFQP